MKMLLPSILEIYIFAWEVVLYWIFTSEIPHLSAWNSDCGTFSWNRCESRIRHGQSREHWRLHAPYKLIIYNLYVFSRTCTFEDIKFSHQHPRILVFIFVKVCIKYLKAETNQNQRLNFLEIVLITLLAFALIASILDLLSAGALIRLSKMS